MAHIAEQFKDKGNALFKAGDYTGAEEQYTYAIQKFSRNPLLFTNRAFARIKLQRWEEVVNDCLRSIEITGHGQNFKAYFYLGRSCDMHSWLRQSLTGCSSGTAGFASPS